MSDYQGLRFAYDDVGQDFLRMKSLTAPFLASDGQQVLEYCARDLDSIRFATSKSPHTWQISKEFPLKTRVSKGEYRASEKGGGKDVFGVLSFAWRIRNPDKGKRRQRYFILDGLASTSILVKTVESDELVARWQFEVGDGNSPGCHFHSAVNQYSDDGLFPEWLKIPRFHGCMLLPLDGLEFLLGELFQLEWRRHISKNTHQRNSWAKGQRDRFQRLLNWQIECVRNSDATPWMSLKNAKPATDLLTKG